MKRNKEKVVTEELAALVNEANELRRLESSFVVHLANRLMDEYGVGRSEAFRQARDFDREVKQKIECTLSKLLVENVSNENDGDTGD